MKSGFVSIVGRPNVGKSTLVNTIVGEKISIISEKPQTTRNLIQGVYNDEDTQIVFIDTPGIHKPKSRLGIILNSQAYYSINDVDVIIFLVDASEKLGKGDLFVMDKFKDLNKPVILVINKIDKLTDEEILKKIDEYKDLYEFSEIVPVSAINNDNVDRLVKVLKSYLTDNVKYFVDNEKTSLSKNFRICEIVREKVFNETNDEIPHSVACVLTNYKEEENIININVDIVVDRDSIRKIILGKSGLKIKKIGIDARNDIEKLVGRQIYLELYVRVIKKWREKEKYLKELGFKENIE